jgi:hypothetical protein
VHYDALANSPTVHQIEVPKVSFPLFDSIVLLERGRKFNTINDEVNYYCSEQISRILRTMTKPLQMCNSWLSYQFCLQCQTPPCTNKSSLSKAYRWRPFSWRLNFNLIWNWNWFKKSEKKRGREIPYHCWRRLRGAASMGGAAWSSSRWRRGGALYRFYFHVNISVVHNLQFWNFKWFHHSL